MMHTELIDPEIQPEPVPQNDKLSSSTKNISAAKLQKIPQPGHLMVEVDLLLHTKIAYHYFYGKPGKTTSLTIFSKKMTQIWQAAAEDDPYADFVLLKVYDAMVQAKRKLHALAERYQQQLAECNLELCTEESLKPMRAPLKFGTPYGYMAGSMLKQFDDVARRIIAAQQLGIPLSKKHGDLLREAGDIVRRVFNKAQAWKKTGISRQAILQKIPDVESVQKQMGELPEQIIAGTLRAPIAPRIVKASPPIEVIV